MSFSKLWHSQVLRAICLIGFIAFGILLSARGWAGRLLTLDMIPSAQQASDFIVFGRLPDQGCLSSLGSYNPPGASWLLMPGVWIFPHDSRLQTLPGAIGLHLLAISGVWALAKLLQGWRSAWIACVLFSLSGLGVQTATMGWIRFPMAATVWFAYFSVRWAYLRNRLDLGLALIVLACGLYIHLEGILLASVLPLLWLLYRPPVSWRVLGMAMGVSFLIWAPYLGFESGRDFADLKSQFTLRSLVPEVAKAEVSVSGKSISASPSVADASNISTPQTEAAGIDVRGWRNWLIEGASTTLDRIVLWPVILGANFVVWDRFLPVATALGFLTAMMVICMAISSFPRTEWVFFQANLVINYWANIPGRVKNILGIILMLSGLMLSPTLLAGILSGDGVIESYTVNMILLVRVMMAGLGVLILVRGVIRRAWWTCRSMDSGIVGVVSWLILPPWGMLLLLSSPEVPYRSWFLWPLQVVCLGMIVEGGWRMNRTKPRWAGGAMAAIITLFTICNPPVVQSLVLWEKSGWRGESEEICALDFLGNRLATNRCALVSVGYVRDCPAWVVKFHAIDPVYKSGLQYDWYLKCRYGVRNAYGSSTGLMPENKFWLVSENYEVNGFSIPRQSVLADGQKIYSNGTYSVWARSIE